MTGGRLFCPTGPPFGVEPDAPDALMMTEGFLLCSDVPFGAALPAWEPPCAIAFAPFTGDSVLDLALCAGAEAPAGVKGVVDAVLVADA